MYSESAAPLARRIGKNLPGSHWGQEISNRLPKITVYCVNLCILFASVMTLQVAIIAFMCSQALQRCSIATLHLSLQHVTLDLTEFLPHKWWTIMWLFCFIVAGLRQLFKSVFPPLGVTLYPSFACDLCFRIVIVKTAGETETREQFTPPNRLSRRTQSCMMCSSDVSLRCIYRLQ